MFCRVMPWHDLMDDKDDFACPRHGVDLPMIRDNYIKGTPWRAPTLAFSL